MADSLSCSAVPLPVAAMSACCESFQLSLLAMTFPLASRNESVGFASGLATPALRERWAERAHTRTRCMTSRGVAADDGASDQHVVAGPDKSHARSGLSAARSHSDQHRRLPPVAMPVVAALPWRKASVGAG